MIPADHIIIDGDTALWVLPPTDKRHAGGEPDAYTVASLNRPCDTCNGSGAETLSPTSWTSNDCPDCIDGRHTFDVTTFCHQLCDVYPCCWPAATCSGGEATFTVHVTDVLPIVDGDTDVDAFATSVTVYDDGEAELWTKHPDPEVKWIAAPITLPHVKPGMWLVRLAVHP